MVTGATFFGLNRFLEVAGLLTPKSSETSFLFLQNICLINSTP